MNWLHCTYIFADVADSPKGSKNFAVHRLSREGSANFLSCTAMGDKCVKWSTAIAKHNLNLPSNQTLTQMLASVQRYRVTSQAAVWGLMKRSWWIHPDKVIARWKIYFYAVPLSLSLSILTGMVEQFTSARRRDSSSTTFTFPSPVDRNSNSFSWGSSGQRMTTPNVPDRSGNKVTKIPRGQSKFSRGGQILSTH